MRVWILAFLESNLGEDLGNNKTYIERNIGASTFLIGLWDAKILRQCLDGTDVYPEAPRVLPFLRSELKIEDIFVHVAISMACLRLAVRLPPRLQVFYYCEHCASAYLMSTQQAHKTAPYSLSSS